MHIARKRNCGLDGQLSRNEFEGMHAMLFDVLISSVGGVFVVARGVNERRAKRVRLRWLKLYPALTVSLSSSLPLPE